MNVSLTADLEKFVQAKVRSGHYSDASQVVQRALKLLREDERVRTPDGEKLRSAIEAGILEADGAQTTPWDTEEIKVMGRKLLAASRAKRQLRRKSA